MCSTLSIQKIVLLPADMLQRESVVERNMHSSVPGVEAHT